MLSRPCTGPITSPYGPRPWLTESPFHNGQDYGWLLVDPAGTRKVYAPTSGRVVVGWNYKVGNFVSLPIGDGFSTRLCHFASVAVANGQYVNRGDYLGLMGSTGSQAAGIHLHVDVFTPAGGRVDPAHFYTQPLAQAGVTVTPITTNPRGADMIVYANTETNVWAAGIPFAGVWQGVPAGQGDAYVKASGRELVRLNNAEFNTVAALCKQQSQMDVRVYADTTSNVWYLVGPGVDYAIPSDKAGFFESIYGTRVPLPTADLTALRQAMRAQPATVDLTGVIASLENLPAQVVNEQARRLSN